MRVKITEIHKEDAFYESRFREMTGEAFDITDWPNGWKRFMFIPDVSMATRPEDDGRVGFWAARFEVLDA